MSLWWTERTPSGELLVFRAGVLVHKRWPSGRSVTFGAVPSFAYDRRAEKEKAREQDRAALEAGAVTREELSRRNGLSWTGGQIDWAKSELYLLRGKKSLGRPYDLTWPTTTATTTPTPRTLAARTDSSIAGRPAGREGATRTRAFGRSAAPRCCSRPAASSVGASGRSCTWAASATPGNATRSRSSLSPWVTWRKRRPSVLGSVGIFAPSSGARSARQRAP